MSGSEKDHFSLPAEITHYYERGLEIQRFKGALGELELLRTKEIVSRYLPDPPVTILDVGGGPGIYASWLALEGHEVHLIDPIPLHRDQAHQASLDQPDHPISSIRIGDARNLEQPDASVDFVLMFGPLYHLTDRNDRILALREAYRVLRNHGHVLVVGISRFASALDGLVRDLLDDPQFMRIVHRDLLDGQHRNPTDKPSYFTTAFLHHPKELAAEVEEAGFHLEKIFALEGPAALLLDLDERWSDRDRREQLLSTLRLLEDEPSILGITGHMMAVARK
ncbi:MAG TPA: methyltransferase domain-containing protein [Anaerolineae bacterium]|nr:methyltransferase domain-containing protein [Anaerolineae bacterium]